MRRKRFSRCLFSMLLLPLLLSINFVSQAQTIPPRSPAPAPSTTPSLEREFLKNILRDQKAIWTAPARVNKDDAKWMVPLGIGTAALIATDRITGDEIAELVNLEEPSRIISAAGSTYAVSAVAASFYLVGRKTNNARARETGILAAQATVDSLIVVTALKGISQRVRPQTGAERSEFFDGGDSFPSGHSTQAWAVATVIAKEYHDRKMVKLAAYGIAGAVSAARFAGGKHYVSDVVVGSLLGYGIGNYVYHAHHRRVAKSGNESGGISELRWPVISPQFNRSTKAYGVALTWNF